ncbi:uncharacterized protein LOC62_04G006389 [Vanrija pseudolonga]|uniref:Uncharacterized protein n=1 Tax=Vanrija pseudolonga TaxID=143232 RepID=A0AAF0YDN8_9TREE|nr:hypothetical protein LOC62_04G006389 [Vanrija pseudolonga]
MLVYSLLMAAHCITSAAASWASAGWQAPKYDPAPLGAPACPTGASASPQVPCIGPGYSPLDNVGITFPKAGDYWVANGSAAAEWSLPRLGRNGSEEVFQMMLYNRNASILPSYVILQNYVNYSNFSTISERKIESLQIAPATGYWAVLATSRQKDVNDQRYNRLWSRYQVWCSSDEFEIKPPGTLQRLPGNYSHINDPYQYPTGPSAAGRP